MKELTSFLNIHVIQSMPPSRPNGDDLGAQKTAIVGGVLRERISSQCKEHAIRKSLDAENCGVRSRYLVYEIAKELDRLLGYTPREDGMPSVASSNIAVSAMGCVGIDADRQTLISATTHFYEPGQVFDVAAGIAKFCESYPEDAAALRADPSEDDAASKEEDAVADSEEDPKPKNSKGKGVEKKNKLAVSATAKKALKKLIEAAYIAKREALGRLWRGSMEAGNPGLNTEGSTQRAHAISTHAVTAENDYFSAADDSELSRGAGHIDSASFMSGTLYDYSNINIRYELELSGGNMQKALRSIRTRLEKSILTAPSGRQNAFAAYTVPTLVMITEDPGQASYANAFECPVKPGEDGGYDRASCERLVAFKKKLDNTYRPSRKVWCIAMEPDVVNGLDAEVGSLDTILDSICDYLGDM